ncbi:MULTISPECIES: DUF2867 domain-containing protein [unclassified Nocardiopsis]|uniref:DUF2867 domain-containing protein n=1 Tax=Nocardiopsis TaxID=2013 RepID=UPI00387B63D1
MRLPDTAHTSRPWRIHGIAPDFRLEDVWDLPTPGGPDDLAHLVRQFTDGTAGSESSPVLRLLFAVRWRLGALLGWDRPGAGVGGRVRSLRERLPEDLRPPEDPDRSGQDPGPGAGPFTPLYQTRDEWAAELANRTVHAVLHLGWVPDGSGGHRGRMAVLVKRNGLLGTLYMAAIKPFRHLGVYSAMIRGIGREWERGARRRAAG